MKKSVVPISSIILLTLFLVSCQGNVAGGDKPIDTATALKAVQTGTEGITVVPIENYPPALIYDRNELTIMLNINNKGNFPLLPQDCFVQITGFDPNIIKSGQNIQSCSATSNTPLEGKNVYNINGGTNQLLFQFLNVELPPGVFEYNPTLNFVTCYKYHTTANPVVCLDPLFYQVTPQQKNCIPKTVSMGGGQGAPVGITYVGVQMIGGKAVFEINVQNLATPGRALSQDTDLQTCGISSITHTDLDKIFYKVTRSDGTPIDCKPYPFIRLVNNNAKIVCTTPVNGASAYETPLLIDLDYNFIQSLQRPIKIVRTPGT